MSFSLETFKEIKDRSLFQNSFFFNELSTSQVLRTWVVFQTEFCRSGPRQEEVLVMCWVKECIYLLKLQEEYVGEGSQLSGSSWCRRSRWGHWTGLLQDVLWNCLEASYLTFCPSGSSEVTHSRPTHLPLSRSLPDFAYLNPLRTSLSCI